MPFRLFRRRPVPAGVSRAYDAVVAQARQPQFYLLAGVPDTIDGRFDMIALHLFLVLERLRGQGPAADAFGQALLESLVADMDASLREIGISDLRVPREIKGMMEGILGRLVAYQRGVAADDDRLLCDALDRNLYGTQAPGPGHLDLMAGYVRRQTAALADQALTAILEGRIGFGPPPAP